MTDKENKNNNLADDILTPKQELFCIHYVKNDQLRGNWTLAYNEAYDLWLYEKDKTREDDDKWNPKVWTSEYDKTSQTCAVNASKLLRRTKIQSRNRELLNEMLSHHVIDARLSEIILKGTFSDSLNAIKEYNKLHSRIIEKNEVKVTSDNPIWDKLKELWYYSKKKKSTISKKTK